MEDRKLLQGIMSKLGSFEIQVTKSFKKLDEKIEVMDKRLTKRLDSIGSSVAYLEDDTPTVNDFRKLEKRVLKLEKQVASS